MSDNQNALFTGAAINSLNITILSKFFLHDVVKW